MKKFFAFLVAAVTLMGFTACSEDATDDVVTPEVSRVAMSFSANIGDQTRVVLDGLKTQWEKGDQITVYSYDESNKKLDSQTFTTEDEGEVATFTGEIAQGANYMAAYGKVTITTYQGNSCNFTTSADAQVAVENSADRNSLYSVAVAAHAEGPITLNFENVSALLKVTPDFNGSLVIKGTKGLTASGNYVFDNKSMYAFSQIKNEVTLSGCQAGKTYYIGVHPNTHANGIEAYGIAEGSQERVLIKSTTESVTFERNKCYDLGTLAIPEREVDATWGLVGDFNGWTAETPDAMYVETEWLVAFNKTGLDKGFKFVKNKGWDGAKGGKLAEGTASTLGEWLGCGEINITAPDASAYDVYFAPERSLYCIVAAGGVAPALPEKPAAITWSLAGSYNSWGENEMKATEVANLFVVEGVELTSGDEIKVKDITTWDTSYGGGITNLNGNSWMKAYFNGSNVVVAATGTYDVYFEYAEGAEYSKLYLIEAGGDYTAATEQTDNGTLIPDEEPGEEVTPGVTSEWALLGVFSSWADKYFVTTSTANVLVLTNVSLKAAEGFLVRKPSTEWVDKYGAANVNYLKANHYITTSKDGVDMCLEAGADGTYDIYFDTNSKNIYIMTAGTDYTTATLQTANGEEPKQEEPEVTEKVLYLKPNSNWTQSNARFAAYFFGNGDKWVSMTDSDKDGIYEVYIPEGYDYGCNIIFCRMNPSTTANNWNNKWNQTADLKAPTDGKNLYTVKAGTWDKGGGTWSVKQ